MDYAVIRIKNNQYMVKPGAKITILGEIGNVGDEVKAEVLMVKDNGLTIGSPVADYALALKVVELKKTDKIDIFTYRAKSRTRRHNGHRQMQSVLEVVESQVKTAKKAEKKTKKAE